MNPSWLVPKLRDAGVGMRILFLAYIGNRCINKRLFKCRGLPRYGVWPHASIYNYGEPVFWLTLPAGKQTVSLIKNRVRLIHSNENSVLKWPFWISGKQSRTNDGRYNNNRDTYFQRVLSEYSRISFESYFCDIYKHFFFGFWFQF